MNKPFASLLRAIFAVMLVYVAMPSQAATTYYSNQAAFVSATGATDATGALPFDPVTTSRTVGSITFQALVSNGLNFGVSHPSYPGGWSTVLPEVNDLAASAEDIDFISSAPVFSMGFQVHEPSVPGSGTDTCGLPVCTDSLFSATLRNGGALVATTTVNFANDTLTFFGAHSSVAFDRIELREITATIDDEFFGRVFTGTIAAAAPIPEPSTWALMALGLGLVAWQARRLRKA